MTEHDLLHVGVSGRYHQPNSATGLSDDRVLRIGNRIRSEAYILNQGLLGTPDLSCGTVALPGWGAAAAAHCVNSVESFGVELSAAHGPFSLQAEYLGQQVNRNTTNIALARLAGAFAPGGASHYFSGFYLYGQWYLTGEERAAAYDVTNKIGANFNQITIKHPMSAGGFGAVGLAARYSALNLNSGPYSGSSLYNMLAYTTLIAPNPVAASYIGNAGVVGGRQQNVTLGSIGIPTMESTFSSTGSMCCKPLRRSMITPCSQPAFRRGKALISTAPIPISLKRARRSIGRRSADERHGSAGLRRTGCFGAPLRMRFIVRKPISDSNRFSCW